MSRERLSNFKNVFRVSNHCSKKSLLIGELRDENPPDLSQAYVLLDENGKAVYEKLTSEGSVNLIGSDEDCTGMNDTSLSEQYYARGKEVPKPSSMSMSVTPTANSYSNTFAT